MPDPISLVTAITGIPGIFKSCVDCFQYVRLGQRFGKDYGICLAKLEAAHIRLTRWGEPLGLLQDKVKVQGSFSDEDIIRAYELLALIEATFEEAQEAAAKYADSRRKKGKDKDLELIDEEHMGLGGSIKLLVTSLKSVSKERQRNLSLPRKITWALYGKDGFDSLIGDIVALTSNLMELFPSNERRMKELCQEEVNNLDDECVFELGRVLQNDDKMLPNTDDAMMSETIRVHVESHRLQFRNVNIDGQGITRLGDTYGYGSGVKPSDVSIDGMTIRGSGYTQAGHVFHGK
ncbi:uncharacterized protein J7T54_003692 [Emericellopsis cladophorae]|uniref:Prion-inhibition and propagation HeLo domain-containing protein n=1 Tax=Emericellopsis cladophorae TaxID=2686198 RepID=A0A9P9XTF0_9HYPO|nr:uncharacterized protein J7T54_003692 [Emericellopsis cladophorae]KAI6777597.1 hypothetical protein J7T54_003692 [Emericellopsis cladophorae]